MKRAKIEQIEQLLTPTRKRLHSVNGIVKTYVWTTSSGKVTRQENQIDLGKGIKPSNT